MHQDAITEHRDEITEHQDENSKHQDDNLEYRGEITEHRDAITEHQDAITEHQDAITMHQDEIMEHQDDDSMDTLIDWVETGPEVRVFAVSCEQWSCGKSAHVQRWGGACSRGGGIGFSGDIGCARLLVGSSRRERRNFQIMRLARRASPTETPARIRLHDVGAGTGADPNPPGE